MNRILASLMMVLPLGLLGCAPGDIDRTYGVRRGTPGGDSVNGTRVLAEMFHQAGFRVNTWRRLSPKLEDYDVIVWFPDDFSPPPADHRVFLEDWLAGGYRRTLVYVGRDYDAGVTYWQKMRPLAPPRQALEVERRLAEAQAELQAARAEQPRERAAEWFTLRTAPAHRRVRQLSGPWSEGIDAAQVEIELAARLTVPRDPQGRPLARRRGAEVEELLRSGDDTLVSRLTAVGWGESQLIVVTNGSFLLNLPLVNHQHRQLAGKLIAACGSPGKAVFLESGPSGPRLLHEEPQEAYPTGLEVFTVWPLGIIVLHLTALGILACFAIYPIFGRPREVPLPSAKVHRGLAAWFASGYYVAHGDASSAEKPQRVVRAHFGKHIDALGELLELTRDRQYAVERLKYYHEYVKRESGVSHRKE